ncbi:MAG TPA: 50S ribosomal protein L13 [Candidatus Sulfotelmatobacter sp.]|nr:50S ribosomal protein L13 [Candidatus Sulfotelmatobacter sp.]
MKKRKTLFTKTSEVKRRWVKINAEGKVLGSLATRVAVLLRGKGKPIFTPQTDCGDFVVVYNAEKIKVTGNKFKDKGYFTHSGHPGGDKLLSFEVMIGKRPEKVIQLAIKGMLPHNRLADQVIKKLKVFRGVPAQYQKLPEVEV